MQKIYTVDEIRQILNKEKNFLKKTFSAIQFFLFGSYAKGLQTESSDIDLLVEFSEDVDLFKLIDLQNFLSDLFKKKVDLGTPSGLKKYIKNIILQEAIRL